MKFIENLEIDDIDNNGLCYAYSDHNLVKDDYVIVE